MVVTVVAEPVVVEADTTVMEVGTPTGTIWLLVVVVVVVVVAKVIGSICPLVISILVTWLASPIASCETICGLILRLVRDPELAALRPRPIFARRLLSEPVFFRRSGGAGGTVVRPAAFLCSCCSLAYCSCRAFCFLRSSWCRCSSCSCLPRLLCRPSCELTLSQELELLVDSTAEDCEDDELCIGAAMFGGADRSPPICSVVDRIIVVVSGGRAMGGLPPRVTGRRKVALPLCRVHGWFLGGSWGLVGLARGDRELVRGGGGGGTLLALASCSSSTFRSGTGGFCPGRKACGNTGIPVGCDSCCSCSDNACSLAMGGEVSVSELDGYECRRRRVPLAPGVIPGKPTMTAEAETAVKVPLDESTLPFRPMSLILGARLPLPPLVVAVMLDSRRLEARPMSARSTFGLECTDRLLDTWPICEPGREKVCSSSSRASSAFSGRCWGSAGDSWGWLPPPRTLADPTTVRSAGTGAAACSFKYVESTVGPDLPLRKRRASVSSRGYISLLKLARRSSTLIGETSCFFFLYALVVSKLSEEASWTRSLNLLSYLYRGAVTITGTSEWTCIKYTAIYIYKYLRV